MFYGIKHCLEAVVRPRELSKHKASSQNFEAINLREHAVSQDQKPSKAGALS